MHLFIGMKGIVWSQLNVFSFFFAVVAVIVGLLLPAQISHQIYFELLDGF